MESERRVGVSRGALYHFVSLLSLCIIFYNGVSQSIKEYGSVSKYITVYNSVSQCIILKYLKSFRNNLSLVR